MRRSLGIAPFGIAVAKAGGLKVGDKVTIYLNPADPADSRLFCEIRTEHWFLAACGSGFALGSIVSVAAAIAIALKT